MEDAQGTPASQFSCHQTKEKKQHKSKKNKNYKRNINVIWRFDVYMYNIIIENENHITTLLTILTLNIEMVNIIVLLIFLVIKKCLTKQLAIQ